MSEEPIEMLTKEEKDFIKQKEELLELINEGYVNVPKLNIVFDHLYNDVELNDQLSYRNDEIFTEDFRRDVKTPKIDMIKNAIKKAKEIKANEEANKLSNKLSNKLCSVMFKKYKSTRKYKYKNKKKVKRSLAFKRKTV